MDTGKKALVLGGGGSRGAYEIGVVKALYENGYRPDIITGTSVGAINGAMIASGKVAEAERMWRELETGMVMEIELAADAATAREQLARLGVFAGEAIKNRGASTAPLRRLLEDAIDEDAVRRSGIDFGFVTVSLPYLKPRAVYTDEIGEGRLVPYLLASSAVFPAMRAQVIGDVNYIDGGFYDSVPVELAMRRGADDITVVDLHAPGLRRRVKSGGAVIRYIETEWDLGSPLIFNPKTAAFDIELGYLDGLKSLKKLDGVLYAFHPEGFFERVDEVARRAVAVFTALNSGEGLISGASAALRMRLLRCVRGFYRHVRQAKERVGVALYEMPGRLFGLPPTAVYTAAGYEAALKSALESYPAAHESRIPEGADMRSVCLWFLRELGKEEPGDAARARVAARGLLFPQELLSALCILAMGSV